MSELLLPAAKVPGVMILPGSEAMDDLNVTRPSETGPLQFTIRDSLAPLALRFDLCLIDCPPNVNLSSWPALAAADGVVVPLQAEDYGDQGLVAVRKAIRRVQAEVNPALVLIGYLITLFNKTLAVHLSYEVDLRQIHGDDVFASVFPLAKDFKEAIARAPGRTVPAPLGRCAGGCGNRRRAVRAERATPCRKEGCLMSKFRDNEAAAAGRLASLTDTTPETPPASSRSSMYDGRSVHREACKIRCDRIVADPDQPRQEFEADSLERSPGA